MSYTKGGIVTRIEIIDNKSKKLINKLFDQNIFEIDNNTYLLKKDIFSKNFWILRQEYLNYLDNKGDSIKNCEACYLDTNINKLETNTILLKEDNKYFYFSNHNKLFTTEIDYYQGLKIYFISIYWNTNKIITEDFSNITLFVNNLTHNALKNKLKGATWFTVI